LSSPWYSMQNLEQQALAPAETRSQTLTCLSSPWYSVQNIKQQALAPAKTRSQTLTCS
jgi:hypothetical protein